MDAHITHGYGGGWRQVGCILLVRSNFLSTCRVSVCCLAVPGPHACRGGRVAVLVSFEPALSFRRCLFRGAFLSLETSKACFLATLGLDTAENYLCFGKWLARTVSNFSDRSTLIQSSAPQTKFRKPSENINFTPRLSTGLAQFRYRLSWFPPWHSPPACRAARSPGLSRGSA